MFLYFISLYFSTIGLGKQGGRPNVPNKAAKIVLKKDRYKMGDSTRSLSHLASQVSSRYMKSEG